MVIHAWCFFLFVQFFIQLWDINTWNPMCYKHECYTVLALFYFVVCQIDYHENLCPCLSWSWCCNLSGEACEVISRQFDLIHLSALFVFVLHQQNKTKKQINKQTNKQKNSPKTMQLGNCTLSTTTNWIYHFLPRCFHIYVWINSLHFFPILVVKAGDYESNKNDKSVKKNPGMH